MAACQGSPDGDDGVVPPEVVTPDTTGHALFAEHPQDLAVRASGDLSFHPSARGFTAGYQTHAVEIDAIGGIRVTPTHFDRATRTSTTGGPIELETTEIVVGDDLLTAAAQLPHVIDDRTIEVQRGSVRERIINAPEGVEQTWRFDSIPDGADGDLRVHVRVGDGVSYTGQTAGGLHFRSAQGLGFAYHDAVWRDSAGKSWDVALRFEDGQIIAQVDGEVLEATAFPAVLDPTVSAEVFTDTPATGTTGTASHNDRVAGDGSGNFLAVWQDNRDSRDDDIFATRIDASGHVLDARGIKIAASTGDQTNPVVTHIGSAGYLVVWQDFKVANGTDSDLKAALVSASGTVTQLGTVVGTATSEIAPAVAGHGDNTALVAWVANKDVFEAPFNGSTFGSAVAVANTATGELEPSVASSSSNYLVTYTLAAAQTGNDLKGQLVTAAGALSGTAFNILAANGSQSQSDATFDGTNYIVVYNNGGGVFGARVSTTGSVLDPQGVQIDKVAGEQRTPHVACTASSGCLVFWDDRRAQATQSIDVLGAIITNAMTLTSTDLPIAATRLAQTDPAVAVSGTQYLATWTDNRDGALQQIVASRVTTTGTATDSPAFDVATGAERQRQAAFARIANFYGMYFAESQIPDFNILGVRFNASGVQLDATPKVVSNTLTAQVSAAATAVGSTFFVAWQDPRSLVDQDIYLARVTPNTGAVLDPSGIALTTATGNQVAPAIGGGSNTALAVWQDGRTGNSNNLDIYGTLVGPTGNIIARDITICAGAGNQTRPAVAYDTVHNVYLVVWSDSGTGTADIRGTVVNTAGVVVGGACGSVISGAANAQFAPSVAFSGTQFLVAWEDRRTDGKGDIFASRVTTTTTALTVVDPNGINVVSQAGVEQDQVSVAPQGGTNWVLAWTDGRNLATTGLDIFAARVNNTGVVETPFAVSAKTGDESQPTVTDGANTSNPILVSYINARPDLDSERLQVRRLTFKTTQGQACSTDAACDSGFCVDSRCCNTACGGNTADCQACSVAHSGQTDGVCGILTGPNIHICRNYVDSSVCDHREYCDGVSAQCPADIGRTGEGGKVCTKNNGTTGHCPLNEGAGGAPHSCQ